MERQPLWAQSDSDYRCHLYGALTQVGDPPVEDRVGSLGLIDLLTRKASIDKRRRRCAWLDPVPQFPAMSRETVRIGGANFTKQDSRMSSQK